MLLEQLSNDILWSDQSVNAGSIYRLALPIAIEDIFHDFIGALLAIATVYAFHYFLIRPKKETTSKTPPQKNAGEEKKQDALSGHKPELSEHSPKKEIENPLWLKIDRVMEEEELWRDPDLSASMMIDRMNTNRTSFSQAIRDGGYDNFNNYLARYRIQAFCKQAENERIENIQDAFFKVGYKARTTAFTQFKKIKGISPTKYIELNGSDLQHRNIQDTHGT